MTHRSSLEWTPPCHGGDRRFESGMGRFRMRKLEWGMRNHDDKNSALYIPDSALNFSAIRQRLERPVLETGVCEFESHSHY